MSSTTAPEDGSHSGGSSGASPDAGGRSSAGGGLIGLFVRHPTAANVLMVAMIALGVVGIVRLNVQFFPTIDVNVISVTVDWPGATASDVESQILDALEPGLRLLDGVEGTIGVAREESAVISVEFEVDADMQKALADAERAVAEVTTLPIDSEPPQVQRITFFEPVSKIAISGPFSEKALKHHARRMRDDLLARGIDQVEFVGVRGEEISVLLPEAIQRELNVSVAEVAARVREAVQNIPSGTLEGEREIQLRSLAAEPTPEGIGDIEVRALPNGEKLLVRDIGEVETRFDRNDPRGQIQGQSAIELRVRRAPSADTLEMTAIIDEYLEKARDRLPPTLQIVQYDNTGRYVLQRLLILAENGLMGLVLVVIVLAIFLDWRIAFWVAFGIPVSLLGAFGFMGLSGQSINMVSVFALIMMIGVIVDDAIVVGEQTATTLAQGLPPDVAAQAGALAMLKPVLAATLTTQAAFLPIFAVTGPIGQVMQVIPMVVIAVLAASLLECFLILPRHLNHSVGPRRQRPSAFRRAFDGGFVALREGPFTAWLHGVVAWRYAFVSLLLGLMLLTSGVVLSDRLRHHFFLTPEPELVRASVVFAPGVPVAEQTAALRVIEGTLSRVQAELTGDPDGRLVDATFTTVGAYDTFERVPLQNVAQIEIAVTASETRDIPTSAIVDAWREAIPPIAGVVNLAVSPVEPAGLPQRPIAIELQGAPLETLKMAAADVADALRRFDGVDAILDDLPYGKQELTMTLTDQGVALGFTMEDVGRQVRNLVEGAVADRFPREDEEVTIKVLRDDAGRRPDTGSLLLLSPQGLWVQLAEIVEFEEVDSFALIRHREGQRTVSVGADVDSDITSASKIIRSLEPSLLEIAERHGVTYRFEGETEEQDQSFRDFRLGMTLALMFIYALLALVLESYIRPLFVLIIVPFGAMGAIVGHMVMGIDLTIVSLIGLLGLTGVLVNDSIIMIDRIGQHIAGGMDVRSAAIAGSRDRLRSIVLTSITTICGLLPILFETSRQAQFLVPLAVTFIFGLMVSTFIVTILVPAMFAIAEDLQQMFEVSSPSKEASPNKT